MPSDIEIESTDVIRLIEQFLKENNLHRTLQTLQEESTVSLNTVDSLSTFTNSITSGHWDAVLKTITSLRLPPKKLLDLYEQITLELLEMRELGAARSILRQTDVMEYMKDHYPDRYLNLESLLSRTYFDGNEVWGDAGKEKRRQIIAQGLSGEVTVVPPSRLLALLGQALKWQDSQGLIPPDTGYDLFTGATPLKNTMEDAPPTTSYATIKFPKKQHCETVAFSPNGQYLVTGTLDGFIEIWNYMTGKLRNDFKYQAEDNLMLMESAILSLAFSADSEMIVSGSQDGGIKVWKVESGVCVKRFLAAHDMGITWIGFTRNGDKVFSASFDGTVRQHGLKSNKTLKHYRGHTSFVNHCTLSQDESRILSASSDGTVKIWDTKTTECLSTISLSEGKTVAAGIQAPTVNRIIRIPNSDEYVICNKSAWIHVVNTRGEVIRSWCVVGNDGVRKDVTFISIALSPKGEYVYCASEEKRIYVFHCETGKGMGDFQVTEADIIGLEHHPFTNIMAVFSDDGIVGLWKQ
ncbi:Serine/threonine-protein kinase smu1 [Gaertneriomyces sp. JEL0708]|nr:Serine/threonine-protein kinase smu1 [Gaertneriomyces sp. JEL0708]